MRFLIIVVLIGQFSMTAQDSIKTVLVKEDKLNADRFIGIDDFGNIYYIKNNTFYKKTPNQTYSYTNTQLGEITSVDLKNSLKILIFYSNFNTALLLDSQLNELTKPFNFTSTSFSKNIAFSNLSSNDNLWLYSLDDNILRLWNHQTKKILFRSQPLSSYSEAYKDFHVVQQFSTYKNCWLVGRQENLILRFDEYGIFLGASKIAPFEDLKPAFDGFIYLKNKQFYFHNIDKNSSTEIAVKNGVTVENFYINNDDLYIFDGTAILVFKILKI